MAEFSKVMRQAKRMCYYIDNCDECPLEYACNAEEFSAFTQPHVSASKMEKLIMDWAAQNPEPRYPTWQEWHDTMFAKSSLEEVPCPKFFLDQARGENLCVESKGCTDCWSNPIPADIAEKLGIKPIGGCDNG